MATLNELKTQITNANALGVEKITNKGGTVAQDADTVAIMNAIDSIPAGGGSDATVVTWNGDTTGVEHVEINLEDEPLTAYKLSDVIFNSVSAGESVIAIGRKDVETNKFEGDFLPVGAGGVEIFAETDNAFILTDEHVLYVIMVLQDNTEYIYDGVTIGTFAHKGFYTIAVSNSYYLSHFVLMPISAE